MPGLKPFVRQTAPGADALARAGAAFWFELARDPPTIRLGAWFVALALIFDQWRRALAAELDQLPNLLKRIAPVRRRDGEGQAPRNSAEELHKSAMRWRTAIHRRNPARLRRRRGDRRPGLTRRYDRLYHA